MSSLAGNVARLSALLTKERHSLPAAYLHDAGLRAAYTSYYLPSNLSKIRTPLQELLAHPTILSTKRKLKALDIGSGPGSALLGMMDLFSEQDHPPGLEITAVDQVADNLKEVERQFIERQGRYASGASLKTIRADIKGVDHLVDGSFDVAVMSNVLNELYHLDPDRLKKRVDFIVAIMQRIMVEDGSIIIIEPALRETSRELLQVRDRLLDMDLNAYSPCLFKGKCPALENPKDWCHEDLPWSAPELIREIDELTGLRKDSLKFSYIVLCKDHRSLADAYARNVFRVVSEPLVSKGKREFYLCGAEGRRLVTRLNKDRSDANESFAAMQRGDIVSLEELDDAGTRWKVGKGTTVVIVQSREKDNNRKQRQRQE